MISLEDRFDNWKSMLHDILNERATELTPWEEDFVSSIEERLNDDRPLTEKQSAILLRIYEERC